MPRSRDGECFQDATLHLYGSCPLESAKVNHFSPRGLSLHPLRPSLLLCLSPFAFFALLTRRPAPSPDSFSLSPILLPLVSADQRGFFLRTGERSRHKGGRTQHGAPACARSHNGLAATLGGESGKKISGVAGCSSNSCVYRPFLSECHTSNTCCVRFCVLPRER